MTSRRGICLAAAASAISTGVFTAGCVGPAIVSVRGARRSDWETASPTAHGMDSAALAATLRAGSEVSALRSLLVVRNGTLVGEAYYAGASVSDVLRVNSIAKSVCSMLVGQALQRGTLPGLSAPLSGLLPEAFAQVPGSAAADVTLEQILSGRTGLVYDWIKEDLALSSADDPVRYALSLPMDARKPPSWNYNNAAVGLIGSMLARAEGLDVAALAARDLFAPLGIEQFAWRRDRSGQPTAFGGLALRTRDLMKLAWTMLDGGRWQGAQVLPAAWATDSIRSRGPAGWGFASISNAGYGFLWFTGTLHGRGVAWGLGYGGQVMMLVPELKLAVGVAATSPPVDELAGQNRAIFDLVAKVVRSVA
jgi:CubicO group peptidase (beta-lactamase class C family)